MSPQGQEPYADGVQLLPEGQLSLLVWGEHPGVSGAVGRQRGGDGEHPTLRVAAQHRAQQGAGQMAPPCGGTESSTGLRQGEVRSLEQTA